MHVRAQYRLQRRYRRALEKIEQVPEQAQVEADIGG
jgi:hypothetical protein